MRTDALAAVSVQAVTIRNRILDRLPALLVFALVSVFASYVIVAYIVHDPLWVQTLEDAHAQSNPG